MVEALRLTPPPDDKQELAFLQAWKAGICLVGYPTFFGLHEMQELERHGGIYHLAPRVQIINKKINELPSSKASLLAAMVSLFNPAEGARLAGKIDARGLGHLVMALSASQREVLSSLILSYKGW